MSRQIGGNEYEEQDKHKRKDTEKVGVDAYEGINGKEGECLGRCLPGKEADCGGLEDKNNADSAGFSTYST